LKEEMIAAGKPVDPPTYEIPFFGGATDTYIHNATTLDVKDNPEQTAKNHEAWDAHQKALAEFRIAERTLVSQFVMEDSVTDFPPDDSWVSRAKKRHVKVPDDPIERKVAWLKVEVFDSWDEFWRLVNQCIQLSNSYNVGTKAEVSAAMEPFQDPAPADGEVPSGNKEG
jgi:hypothetical protein